MNDLELVELLKTLPAFHVSADHRLPADGYKGSIHSEVRRSGGRRFWYRHYRDRSGRQHKQYIRLGDLGRVLAGVKAWREFERACRERGKQWDDWRAEFEAEQAVERKR